MKPEVNTSTPPVAVGSRWKPRDRRYTWKIVDVVGMDEEFFYTQRAGRPSKVRRDRWHKAYTPFAG